MSLSTGVLIRAVNPESDLGPLLGLVRTAISESRYAQFGFAEARVAAALDRAMREDPATRILVAEMDTGKPDRVVGTIIASMGQLRFVEAVIARMQLFYVLPEFRRSRAAFFLLDGMRNWARQAGAEEITVHLGGLANPDRRIDRLFMRKGFATSGENLYKAL